MADPWIKFYPSDWLAGTRGLSAAEAGVYITLICMMYEREGPVVMEDDRLARLCGLPARNFRRAVDALTGLGKLIERDGGLWNARVGETLNERQKTNSLRSLAATSRWEKTKEKQPHDDAPALHLECYNQKPDTREEKELPNGSSKNKASAKRGTRLSEHWRLPKDWGEWAMSEGMDEVSVRREADSFRDYWIAQPGQKGVKLNWQSTWRNWIRRALERHPKKSRTEPQVGQRVVRPDGAVLEYEGGAVGWQRVWE